MGKPRVVIVGAGPAGGRAAEACVRHGIRPVVLDEAPRSGGQIYRRPPPGFGRPVRALYGFEATKARRIHNTFDALRDHIEYRPSTLVWNVYDNALRTFADGAVGCVPYDAVILAPGATDRIFPIPGWTKPGAYTLGAAQIALKYQATAIGRRVVFIGTGPLLYLVAYQYAKAGVEVAAVLDTTPWSTRLQALRGLTADPVAVAKGAFYVAWLKACRIAIEYGVRPIALQGDMSVEGLRYDVSGGSERYVAADAVAFGYWLRPETQLADLARCDFHFDREQRVWVPVADCDGRTSVKDVYVAGDGARIGGADVAEAAGELAALAALADFGVARDETRMSRLRQYLNRQKRFRAALDAAFPIPHHLARGLPDNTIVCRCEAITAAELRAAAGPMGAREVNKAKAFSRVGMGRCQGRFCGLAAAEIIAEALGADIEHVGRLRGQAPVKPVPIQQSEAL